MAHFTVLEAPDGNPDRITTVKEGFSAGALVFTVFWALWHRMWVVAVVLFVLFVAVASAVATQVLDPAVAGVLEAAIAVLFGFEARSLHLMSLERAGYRVVGLISTTSREAAELDYFMSRRREQLKPPPPILPPAAHDTLGLFGNV
jgi:hypothetical protein